MIDSFEGKYAFLSNFDETPFHLAGWTLKSVEHGYQAMKTTVDAEAIAILECATPGQSKKLGRKATIREDWDDVKLNIMEALLIAKFCQNHGLAQKLADTDPHELVEGNWWGDVYWGVCKGRGENNLGKLLMKLRAQMLAVGVGKWCAARLVDFGPVPPKDDIRPNLLADMHELDDEDENTRI